MNKAEALFNEYVSNLYDAEYVNPEGGRKKYLFHRLVVGTGSLKDMEDKFSGVFGKPYIDGSEHKDVILDGVRYSVWKGQRLYCCRVKNPKTLYTIQVCQWMPFSDDDKARLKGKFPDEPVTVIFRKVLSDSYRDDTDPGQ